MTVVSRAMTPLVAVVVEHRESRMLAARRPKLMLGTLRLENVERRAKAAA